MLGNFKNRLYYRLFFQTFKIYLFFIGNDGLSSKQVGSQAIRRVTRRLAWIQPVCISINAVPALKGLIPDCGIAGHAVQRDPAGQPRLLQHPGGPAGLLLPGRHKVK